MVELTVEFAHVTFKNPIIVSSSDATIDFKRMKKCAEAGAGGLVTKTVTTVEEARRNLRPRWAVVDRKGFPEIFTYYSVGALSPYEPEKFAEDVRKAKKTLDIPIIASIMGKEFDEWRHLAILMENTGADMIELNLSCPFMPETMKDTGRRIGQDPKLAAEVTKIVKESVSIPVIPKLTPETSDLVEVAKNVERAGADAITAINRFMGIEIDVEKGMPILQPAFAGYGGAYLRGVSLRWVAKIVPEVSIPVSGCAGIMNWSHAVEYFMVGATTAQLFTAIMAKGYGVIGDIVSGVRCFMERQGYERVKDFQGIALKHIVPSHQLPILPLISKVDEDKCTGCGLCVISCLWEALTLSGTGKGKKAVTDAAECEGCGICVSICPQKAISMCEHAPHHP